MKNRPFAVLLFLMLGVVVVGGIARSGHMRPGLGIYPEVNTFTASATSIRAGEPITLTWKTRGTQSVAIDFGPENATRDRMQHLADLPVNGSIRMQPNETTVYEVACNTISDGSMCLPAKVVVEVNDLAVNAKLN